MGYWEELEYLNKRLADVVEELGRLHQKYMGTHGEFDFDLAEYEYFENRWADLEWEHTKVTDQLRGLDDPYCHMMAEWEQIQISEWGDEPTFEPLHIRSQPVSVQDYGSRHRPKFKAISYARNRDRR